MPAVFSRFGTIEHHLRPRRALTLRLYTNEFTPHRGQSLSDFEEASFPGYKPIELSTAEWSDSGADPVSIRHAKHTFSLAEDLSSPVSICGYYLTDGDNVVLADNFGNRRLEVAHSRIDITPIIGER